jgi:hypothetical protein
MSWWTIPMMVLAAPVLLLALAGCAVASALRRIGAAAAPQPEISQWDSFDGPGAWRAVRRGPVPRWTCGRAVREPQVHAAAAGRREPWLVN